MDCPAILAEVEANNRRVQELASEEGWKTAQPLGQSQDMSIGSGGYGFNITNDRGRPLVTFLCDTRGS
jgi:hypothetical protein